MDLQQRRKSKNDQKIIEDKIIDKKLRKLNKQIAENIGNDQQSQEQSGESLAKPKKKQRIIKKKVNFYASSNQDSDGNQLPNLNTQQRGRDLKHLPPKNPDSNRNSQVYDPAMQPTNTSRRSRQSMGCASSVENYQRYYQDNRPDAHILNDLSRTEQEIEPDVTQGHYNDFLKGQSSQYEQFQQIQQQDPQSKRQDNNEFIRKSRAHYDEYKESIQRSKNQKQVNQYFEPQFIKTNQQETKADASSEDDNQFQRIGFGVNEQAGDQMGNIKINYGMNWIAKPTKEGFIYFCIPGTNTYQWDFPKVFDAKTRQSNYLFISHWEKMNSTSVNGPKKYWQHKTNPNFKQQVKPHSQTYLIQAAMEGNLAFLELYTKFKGDLSVCDQSGRSALIHSISNSNIQFAKMLCEFTQVFKHAIEQPNTFVNILELPDRHGNTPLFIAIRMNNPAILEMLISYDCNLLHRRKNGNTCLHECAVHSSVDCLTMLASYCGSDLFHIINKEGYRALDLALNNTVSASTDKGWHKNRASEITIALQKIERNLMYQNAVNDRNLQTKVKKEQFIEKPQRKSMASKMYKTRQSSKTHRPTMDDVSSFSSNSEYVKPKPKSHRKTRRSAPVYSSDDQLSSQKSVGSYGRIKNLEKRYDHLQFQGRDDFDEKKYLKHISVQKKKRRNDRLQEENAPNFRKFRDNLQEKNKNKKYYQQQEAEIDQQYREFFDGNQEDTVDHYDRRHKSRTQREPVQKYEKYGPPARIDPQSSRSYYNKMRQQKNHQDQFFGEDSYFKPGELAERSRSKIMHQSQSRINNKSQKSMVHFEPIEETPDDSRIEEVKHSMRRDLQQKRPFEGEMYNSRFVNNDRPNTTKNQSKNFTIDDIEKQRFRVSNRASRDEFPEVQSYDHTPDRQVARNHRRNRSVSNKGLRDQGYRMVERAYRNTASTLWTMGSMIYTGLYKVKSIVYDPYGYPVKPNSRRRAKSVHYQQNRKDRELECYDDKRGNNRRSYEHKYPQRSQSRDFYSPSEASRSESMPSHDQYYTAHENARSKSRAKSRARSRTLGRQQDKITNEPPMRNMYPKQQHSSSESDAETHEEYIVQVEQRNQISNNIQQYSPVTDQHQNNHNEGGMQVVQQMQLIEQRESVVQNQKCSISIQADSFVRKTKKTRKIKRSRIEKSKQSIGVGSICIDDEVEIQETIYEQIEQKAPTKIKKNKNLLAIQEHPNNETCQSIASQKLEHSRMISFQRQRRTGKRLGKKAHQNLMENKHFQSSDEEKMQIQKCLKLSEQLEPAPHYLRQEVQYLKVKDAYDKNDQAKIDNQVKKMEQLEVEQKNLLKIQLEKAKPNPTVYIIDDMDNYEKTSGFDKDNEEDKKEQSTPTRNSTQQNRKSIDRLPSQDQIVVQQQLSTQKPVSPNNDIDDFYKQLVNNMTTTRIEQTRIEDKQGENELQNVIAQVQQQDKDQKKRDQLQDPVLKELYEGLEISEEKTLTEQLDMLRQQAEENFKNVQQNQEKDKEDAFGMAFSDKTSEINFDENECNNSLNEFIEQDTVTDLEGGGPRQKKDKLHDQKVDNFDFLGQNSDGKDSLDMALDGTLLNPIDKFAECLSECTFILEENKEHNMLYGSRMQSNVFDKGALMNSMANYSCFSQANNRGGPHKRSLSGVNNMSMGVGQQILANINNNNSGFGFMTNNGPSLLSGGYPSLLPPSPVKKERDVEHIPGAKKFKPPTQAEAMRRSTTAAQSFADMTPDLGNKKVARENSSDNGSDKYFDQIDEDKFNKVIEQNIKAIPKKRIPKHQRSGSSLRRGTSTTSASKRLIPRARAQNKSPDAEKAIESIKKQEEKSSIPESNVKVQMSEDSLSDKSTPGNDSSASLEPGALTRISDDNITPQVDQAYVAENTDTRPTEDVVDDHHAIVTPQKQKEILEDKIEKVEEIDIHQPTEIVQIQMAEEPQIPQEYKSPKIFKSKPPSSILNNQETKPTISASRYAEDEEENSILEKKSDVGMKSGLRSIRYEKNPTTFDRSNTFNETNIDGTEIDFDLTQLNQTKMQQQQERTILAGKTYMEIEASRIEEVPGEGEQSAQRTDGKRSILPCDFKEQQNFLGRVSITFENENPIVQEEDMDIHEPPKIDLGGELDDLDAYIKNEEQNMMQIPKSDTWDSPIEKAESIVSAPQGLILQKSQEKVEEIQEEPEQVAQPAEELHTPIQSPDLKNTILGGAIQPVEEFQITPLKSADIRNQNTIIGGYNPVSEYQSSDADLPKLKSTNNTILKSILNKPPQYTSDIEQSKLPSHMKLLQDKKVSNAPGPNDGSNKSPKNKSQNDTGSILGEMFGRRHLMTSDDEGGSRGSHNKKQNKMMNRLIHSKKLLPPKDGVKNLKLRVSSNSRSRSQSQNSRAGMSEKKQEGSIRSKTSDQQHKVQLKLTQNLSNQCDSEKEGMDFQTNSDIKVRQSSQQNSLAEKLAKMKRPQSMMSSFQNMNNLSKMSNKKSIRDVGFRNANSSRDCSGLPATSILTDNSERLRDNLLSMKKTKSFKSIRDSKKSESQTPHDPRKKYRAQPIQDNSDSVEQTVPLKNSGNRTHRQ